MTIKDYFSYLVTEIHSTVIATVDEKGLPVTCVICPARAVEKRGGMC